MSTLARRQWGNIQRSQLVGLGVPPRTVDLWLTSGDLIRVYASVYAVGHIEPGPIPAACAAVLACGNGAALSHDSAAALWGLGRWPSMPEVSAPKERRRPGIRTHRSTTLTRADVTWQRGIRVTTPVRTICDIASRRTDDQLLKAVDDARIAGWLGDDDTDELLLRCARLRPLVGAGATRSRLERAWRIFARRQKLPPHHTNHRLLGYELDVYFPDHHLVVELDGWHYHRGPRSFHDDRVRDTVLKDHGIDTIRLTEDRLSDDEGARLHRILRNQTA